MLKPTWVIAEIDQKEYIELDEAGHQIFRLPSPVARHFVAPLQQRKGTHIVAFRMDEIDLVALARGKETTQ